MRVQSITTKNRRKSLIIRENGRKLDPLYHNPYTVISIDNVNCLIKDKQID